MEMIGEFWSRGSEKFSGDTGEVPYEQMISIVHTKN